VVVNARPYPVINGSHTACLNQKANTFTANLQSGVGYQWAAAGGNIVNGNGTNSISVLWNTAGTYSVSVRAVNLSTGCDSTTTYLVNVDSLPKPVITANGLTGCSPLNVGFFGNQVNPGDAYMWTFGDGQFSSAVNPAHVYNKPGTYSITLVATNASGCKDSAKAQVVTYPSPVSYFVSHVSPDFYFNNTSPFTLDNLSTGGIKYHWNFGNGDTSLVFEPSYQYNLPGQYTITLTVTNSYGCLDVMQGVIDIKVPEDIYIPNAFTPNGDHRNERFSVATKNITDLTVRIFDRWGAQIYYSNDKDFGWDGTYKGKDVIQDVYVYMIKATGYEGKNFDKVGTVTVVR
jgi:gliding motility-associated-like protein